MAEKQKMPATNPSDLPPVANVEEVASCLRVSTKTIYKMIKHDELPARRIGSSIRIHRDTFIDWLRGRQ